MAYGDITATIIDTLSFASDTQPHACHVAGNVYALVSAGASPLMIRTIAISPAGIFTDTPIDTLEIASPNHVNYPTITKIASGMYAILGSVGNTMGWRIITIGIDDAGNIDAAVTETQDGDADYDNGDPSQNGLIRISGDVWAFAVYNLWGTAPNEKTGPVIRTVTITAAGAISATISALAIITGTTGAYSFDFFFHFFHVSSTAYGIVYTGGSEDAAVTLKTFTIATDGTISAVLDTEVIATFVDPAWPPAGSPVAFKVYGTVWAIAYNAATDAGTLKTYDIASNGTISAAISTWEFDATSYAGGLVSIIHTDKNRWTFFYRQTSSALQGVTVTISDAGVITQSLFANQNFSLDARPGNLIPIATDYYLLVIDNAGTATSLNTVKVSTYRPGGWVQII